MECVLTRLYLYTYFKTKAYNLCYMCEKKYGFSPWALKPSKND
jgi:hypothetical protein